jgi:hypothetical protein
MVFCILYRGRVLQTEKFRLFSPIWRENKKVLHSLAVLLRTQSYLLIHLGCFIDATWNPPVTVSRTVVKIELMQFGMHCMRDFGSLSHVKELFFLENLRIELNHTLQ